MDPIRREQIQAAARDLGPEPFNRLVESVDEARRLGRLRYWQEELLGRLPGVGPISVSDFVDAFDGVVAMPVPPAERAAAVPAERATPIGRIMMDHPRLGRLTLVEEYEDYEEDEVRLWEGAVRLPSFAARGVALRGADDPPAGLVRVRVEDPGGTTGTSPQQEAAIAHLLDREPAVFAAVWGELAPEFEGLDLDTQVLCTEVVVSLLHIDGVAYLGFSIHDDCDLHLEHGFQVVYHPTRGTFWGDWEALNCIDEADN